MAQFFYQTLAFLAILGAVSSYFNATMVNVNVIVGTWDCLPHATFCKNHLREYTFGENFIPKITNFGDLGGCKPTFLKPQR